MHRNTRLLLGWAVAGIGLLCGTTPLSAQEPKLRTTLKGHTDSVYAVAYSRDGKTLASGSKDKSIKLWDAATGAERLALKGHGERLRALAFSPDDKTLASGSDDTTIRLWNVATGSATHAQGAHG